jgi:hypothetical protein
MTAAIAAAARGGLAGRHRPAGARGLASFPG